MQESEHENSALLDNRNQRKTVGLNQTANENTVTQIDHADLDTEEAAAKKKKIIKYSIIGGGVIIAISLIIVLSVTLSGGDDEGVHINNPPIPTPTPGPIIDIVDPFAYQEMNFYTTLSSTIQDSTVNLRVSGTIPPSTESMLEQGILGDPFDGRTYKPINPKSISNGLNNMWSDTADFTLTMVDTYTSQLIVQNPSIQQVPITSYAFIRPQPLASGKLSDIGLQLSSKDDPFSFNLTNPMTQSTIISTYKRKLIVAEKFQELGLVLPSNMVFGLGQHNSQFQLTNGTYTLWAKGRETGLPNDNQEGGLNGPHIHPFILGKTLDNDFYGIFFASSAQQTFEIITYDNHDSIILNYIQLYGQMEIYFFLSGSAKNIIQRYHAMIGTPQIPPYFALGYFQGSNTYNSLTEVKAMIQAYSDAGMALEGVVIDQYNAQLSQPFTVDPINFANLQTFSDQLVMQNQHMILGIKGGVEAKSGYKYYDLLTKGNIAVMSTLYAGKPLLGFQETSVIYPDYQAGKGIEDFYTTALGDLDKISHFEGVLLQSNQYYSIISGEKPQTAQEEEEQNNQKRLLDQTTVQLTEDTTGTWTGSYLINPDQSYLSLYNLPIIPGYQWAGTLENQSISLNATHVGGQTEFEVHNINGHMNVKEVYNVLNTQKTAWSKSGQRPLIFSDSTWAGSGSMSAVALNDMWREWANLRNTISQAMSFSMYGISNLASDICGGLGDLDEELCGRWAQVSAFMPMIRNYYNFTYMDPIDQTLKRTQGSEFYKLSDTYQAEFMASSALNQRLQYTRYIYTQMFQVYLKGGPLVYPLFFDAPQDPQIYNNIDDSFMIGDAIKVSPVLEKGVTVDFQSYFPQGVWADLNNQSVINSEGSLFILNNSYAFTHIHIKEGKIIPYQPNPNQFKKMHDFETQVQITFVVNREMTGLTAEGHTLVDDGINITTWNSQNYAMYKVQYATKTFSFNVDAGSAVYEVPTGYSTDQLGGIQFLNAMDLSGTDFACYFNWDQEPVANLTFSYNPYKQVLNLKPQTGDVLKFADIAFVIFGNSHQETNVCAFGAFIVDPLAYQEMNPYTISSQSAPSDWVATTIIKQATQEQIAEQEQQIYQVLGDPLNGRTYRPVNPNNIANGANNVWFDEVSFDFSLLDNYQAKLIISDPNSQVQYQVSDYAFARPALSFEARFTQVGFVQSKAPQPYSFNFSNIYNGETLVSTYKRKLLVSDKFSEIGFVLPTNRIFGLGQHNSQFQLKNGTYTLWSRGRVGGLPNDNAEGGLNGRHIHPFILCQTANKDFFGIFFAGSSGQSFEIIKYQDHDNVILNYIQLGGKLEIYFMMRGTAQEILTRYHTLIGFSQVPPYYALGFFQGSSAYTTQAQVEAVVQSYNDAGMALEGVIIDNYNPHPNQVFVVDPIDYPTLSALSDTLSASDQHIILGVQSGIDSTATGGYAYRDNLLNQNKAVRSSLKPGQPLVGYQETTVIYPDYFQGANIEGFFQDALENLDQQSHFSGIWLQHNDYFSNLPGEILTLTDSEDENLRRILLQDDSGVQLNEDNSGTWEGSYLINAVQTVLSYYNIPYVPGFGWSGPIDNSTISPNATHWNGETMVQDYFLHNLNGHLSLKEVTNALKASTSRSNAGSRPLVFSDSTWVGSGARGAVALSDMWRSWSNLRTTISQVMSLNMFGVSNVASDICGGLGPIDEELCGRWAQLAAFMPLVRNYYNLTYLDAKTQKPVANPASEFYLLADNYPSEVMASSALNQRLQYMRYIYSQMYKVYLKGGSLVYPLFFDYPEDDNCFQDIEHTFMMGDSIKVSPVLAAGVTDTFQAYFPAGVWADLNVLETSIYSTGQYIKLDQSEAYTNIHLKEGRIIPFQANPNQYKHTQDFLTKVKMSFIVHRDQSDFAEGFTLVDDGKSENSWNDVLFTFWKLRYAEKSINFWVEWGDFEYEVPEGYTIDQLEAIHIVNAEDLSGTNFACYLGTNLNPVNLTYSYNPYKKVLTLTPQNGDTVKFNEIGFIKFGNSFQEPNFCDYATAFTYQVSSIDMVKSNNQRLVMTLKSMQTNSKLEDLMVTVQLLDNTGTINLNITTVADSISGTDKYKPDHVTDYTLYSQTPVTMRLDQYFSFSAKPFSYQIFSQDNPDSVIYQSDPHKLYFEDYLIFDSGIFTLNPLTGFPLMGMGERAGSMFYTDDGIYSRYTFDQANPIDDGNPPGKNMYGFQPMYVYQSHSTEWVGVFDLNSYATDYLLQFNHGIKTQITKVSIGGMIQKFFFVGMKPDEVTTKYEMLAGMPILPPLWSFGWQQCRFGWRNDTEWWNVVQSYEDFNIPLDTMWADIDYMDDYKIFTISQSRYSKLATYVDQIRAKGMTFVPIMDVGVAVRPNEGYTAYDEGIKQNVFIQQFDGSAPLTAGVWCGHAYFPDFFNKNINNYWHSQFDYLTSEYGLNFDGIWIDMNEATNFCNGYCIPSERPIDSLRNKPYYVPGWRDLEDKALGVDGLHPDAWLGGDLHEYDVHNMYSLVQVKSTSEYLSQKKNLRPFVLSRSNFPGLGKYGHHWIGDNWSTVEYMGLSVPGIYSYQLFGLPFMGSDICGFDGDATPDLCTRWHQLGSLYPFARNHNQNASISQEPYVFNTPYPQNPTLTYTDIITTALRTRYAFIKYYYSQFQNMHTFGGSFFKPLFFEWVADPQAYNDIEINILIGDSLKASILTTKLGQDSTNYYFPAGQWCQVMPMITDSASCINGATGSFITLSSTLTDYQIHLRGGYAIPMQDAILNNVLTTKDLGKIPTNLVFLPTPASQTLVSHYATYNSAAFGYIYFDDGVTLDQLPSRFDYFINIDSTTPTTQTIYFKQVLLGYPRQNTIEENIGTITILMATTSALPTIQATLLSDGSKVTLDFTSKNSILTITVSSPGKSLGFYDIDYITIQ